MVNPSQKPRNPASAGTNFQTKKLKYKSCLLSITAVFPPTPLSRPLTRGVKRWRGFSYPTSLLEYIERKKPLLSQPEILKSSDCKTKTIKTHLYLQVFSSCFYIYIYIFPLKRCRFVRSESITSQGPRCGGPGRNYLSNLEDMMYVS